MSRYRLKKDLMGIIGVGLFIGLFLKFVFDQVKKEGIKWIKKEL